MKLPIMIVVIGIAVLTITDTRLQVALVEWGTPPYGGRQALSGGLVLPRESVMDAAQRELVEETGLDLDTIHLEQLATFGEPEHDPRSHVASIAHPALIASLGGLTPGPDAPGTYWYPVDNLPFLTFSHDEILRTGIGRVQTKPGYTTVVTRFCGPRFIMTELRQVYEAA